MAAPPTLLLSAFFALVSGALYAYVGHVVHRREVEGEAHLAARLFAMFWYLLGGITAVGASNSVLGWMGVTQPAVYITILHVTFLVIFVALWALLYYFVYLFLGSRKLLWPVTAFYVALYAWFLYLMASVGSATVLVDAWTVRLDYEHDLDPTSLPARLFGVLFILPPIVGAVAYARLFFKVEDLTQRYRIGMVAGTIIAWFSTSLLANVMQLGQAGWWQVTSRLVGVAAALAIYYAYRPPEWVRRRFGIRAIDEPAIE